MAGFEEGDDEDISRTSVPNNTLLNATNRSSPKTSQGAPVLLNSTDAILSEVKSHNEHSEASDEATRHHEPKDLKGYKDCPQLPRSHRE